MSVSPDLGLLVLAKFGDTVLVAHYMTVAWNVTCSQEVLDTPDH